MRLSVNIDHIATVRQARRGSEPSPVEGALEALKAGCDGITFHLREDRRHIQDSDVYAIKNKVPALLNFEAGLSPDIIDLIVKIKPYEATLVPEKRQEITTEGGLDVAANKERLLKVIPVLKAQKILVSLFVEADLKQIDACREVGADSIELHTGKYSNLTSQPEIDRELKQIQAMADYAKSLGFIVHAGHGLNYENVGKIAAMRNIDELNIGHGIISRSIMVGMHQAVKEMIKIIKG